MKRLLKNNKCNNLIVVQKSIGVFRFPISFDYLKTTIY